MYFVREFGSGLDTNRRDPRDKIFAEYKCALCGQLSEIDVTVTRLTFDFDRERKCPHCGQIDAEDKLMNLRANLEKLTTEKSRIQIEIDKVERELNEYECQFKSDEGK